MDFTDIRAYICKARANTDYMSIEATHTTNRILEVLSSLPYPLRVEKRKAICDALGVSSQRLSQIANSTGENDASEDQLQVIAQQLKVSVEELIR